MPFLVCPACAVSSVDHGLEPATRAGTIRRRGSCCASRRNLAEGDVRTGRQGFRELGLPKTSATAIRQGASKTRNNSSMPRSRTSSVMKSLTFTDQTYIQINHAVIVRNTRMGVSQLDGKTNDTKLGVLMIWAKGRRRTADSTRARRIACRRAVIRVNWTQHVCSRGGKLCASQHLVRRSEGDAVMCVLWGDYRGCAIDLPHRAARAMTSTRLPAGGSCHRDRGRPQTST